MKKYINILKASQLFADIGEEEILRMLDCLGARLCRYSKNEYILRQGEKSRGIAVLLEGSLYIQNDDFWGSRTILGHICSGEMFSEAYYGIPMANDVVAVTDCAVIFLEIEKLLSVCSSACSCHTKVIQNLFFAISAKNRFLVQKLGHVSRRSTREKLISYLSEQAAKQKDSNITIPFNRQQLADFLSVDRSAMSNELCKMRDEGLLVFNKNKFRLL